MKKSHNRRKTEITGAGKVEDLPNFDNTTSHDAFEKTAGGANRRRLNVNFERTMDFFGMGNNNTNNFNATGQSPGMGALFKTLHDQTVLGNQNFQSAAMAMEGDSHAGFSRTGTSLFGIPRKQHSSFHSRHNSAAMGKQAGKHFDTDGDGKFSALDAPNSQLRAGKTFDERNHKRSTSMYETFDQNRLMKQNTLKANNLNSSFDMSGTFKFRRTVARIPSFMKRQKISRTHSIQKNVDQIRRNSSLDNVVT